MSAHVSGEGNDRRDNIMLDWLRGNIIIIDGSNESKSDLLIFFLSLILKEFCTAPPYCYLCLAAM